LKPSRKSFIAAGLLTFLAGLVILFPARVAYRWFAPENTQLSGISGSVWSGAAQEMSVAGLYLRDLRWRLRPLQLVTAKIALSLEASLSSGFVEANVAVGPGGRIAVTDLNGSVPLQAVAALVRIPGLSGNASVQLAELDVRNGLPVAVVGTVAVANLVAPPIDSGSIGGYRAEFFTAADGVSASVEDTDAVFDFAGSLKISPDRSYQFIGRIAPTDRTSEKLRQQLRFLGSPDERGQHQIRLEGTL